MEQLFPALATDLQTEEPCYLIHPEGIWRAGFSGSGSRVGYERISCFLTVDEATRNPALCEQVRSVSTLFQSGAALNREACIRATTGNAAVSRALDLPSALELAGYTLSDVDAMLVSKGRFPSSERAGCFRDNEPGIYWNEVRQYVLASPESFDRIDDMPGFASEEDREAMRRVAWRPRFQRDLPLPKERAASRRGSEVRGPVLGEGR